MLAAEGRAGAAATHLDATLSALVDLTERGQLQHARRWMDGLCEHATTLIERASTSEQVPGIGGGASLLRALARPPRCGVYGLSTPTQAVSGGLDQLAQWSASVSAATRAVPWFADFADAFFVHLLDGTAHLLSESDPDELRRHLEATATLLTRLRQAARALPRGNERLADWFLRTRGLRAQRSAVAAGGDRRLVVLRERLAQLRRLEEEALRAHHRRERQPAADGGPQRRRRRRRSFAGNAVAGAARALQQIARAAREGRPAALRLDARSLATRMRPRSALLMLARGAPGELIAIDLHRPSAEGAFATQRIVTLTGTDAQIDGVAVIRLLRQALRPPGVALRRAPKATCWKLPPARWQRSNSPSSRHAACMN